MKWHQINTTTMNSNVNNVILALGRLFEEETFSFDNCVAWCFDALRSVADIKNMGGFIDIPLEVPSGDTKLIQLPPNIFKLEEVYKTKGSTTSDVDYRIHGKTIQLDKDYPSDVVYISFAGTLLDDDCNPLIPEKWENACVHHIVYNKFYGKYISGNLPSNVWADIKENKRVAFQAADSNYVDYTADDWRRMSIINGNMIVKIGSFVLNHKRFTNGS